MTHDSSVSQSVPVAGAHLRLGQGRPGMYHRAHTACHAHAHAVTSVSESSVWCRPTACTCRGGTHPHPHALTPTSTPSNSKSSQVRDSRQIWKLWTTQHHGSQARKRAATQPTTTYYRVQPQKPGLTENNIIKCTVKDRHTHTRTMPHTVQLNLKLCHHMLARLHATLT